MISHANYSRMSDEQKHLLNLNIVHQLIRLRYNHPEAAKKARKAADDVFYRNPHLPLPREHVEAYAALALAGNTEHEHWLNPLEVARLKTWFSSVGTELE